MSTADPYPETLSAPPWRVEMVPVIDSTNAACLRRAAEGEPEGLAVLADCQDAGRGRRGAAWLARPGEAVLLSVLLRPAAPPASWPRLALAAGLAVCDAIEACLPVAPMVKWPNDVLIDGHKLAGILVESETPRPGHPGAAVVGIGMNVHTTRFPDGLRLPATSLRLAAGHAPDRATLAAGLLHHLYHRCRQAFEDWETLRAAFGERDLLAGRQVAATTPGGMVEGVGRGLDDEGCYILEGSGGAERTLRDAHHVKTGE